MTPPEMFKVIDRMIRKGRFESLDAWFFPGDVDRISIDSCLDMLRFSFRARWLMPRWFKFRDALRDRMIRESRPWATEMAGLFGGDK